MPLEGITPGWVQSASYSLAASIVPGYPCPVNKPKSREPKYIAILALSCALFLIVGWLARPREIPDSPAPSQTELDQLARRAERRSLEDISKFFAETARRVESSIVRIQSAQASGIVWEKARIVTVPLESRRVPEGLTVSSSAGKAKAKPFAWGPRLPFAALESPADLAALGVTPARRALSYPHAGDWIVAVWRAEGKPVFVPGNFLQSTSVVCGVTSIEEVVSSLSLTPAMAGGGLFDMDGNLFAVILPCGERLAALANASIESMLVKSNTVEEQVLSRYGLAVSTLSDGESAFFRTRDGVIVREVWTGYTGDQAGLMAGDIVTALNGKVVAQPDDLRLLAAPSDLSAFELEVHRGPKKLKITVEGIDGEDSSGKKVAPGHGLVWESTPRSYRIDAVLADSRAAKAGIKAGDRLVRIDYTEPRSLAHVQQIFGDKKASPVFVEIDRGGRRVGILLP